MFKLFFHRRGRQAVSGPDIQSFDILFEQFAQRRPLSESRLRQYRVLQRMVHRYESFVRAQGDPGFVFDVSRVDLADIEGLERFLRQEEGRPRRSDNYLRGMLVALKGFFAWCETGGVPTARPFARYGMPREEYGTPVILTLAEVERLRRAPMPSRRVAVQRDVFVFQCQVGCRYGDLVRLTQASVQEGILSYIAGKTRGVSGRTVSVPLNRTALRILARYAPAGDDLDAPLLPFCPLREYNGCIRQAFAAAGLTRMVTVLDPVSREEVRRPLDALASSHLARRTFAGNLYRQVKDPALVSSMTGHVDGSRAFARYREIDLAMKRELVRLLELPAKGR